MMAFRFIVLLLPALLAWLSGCSDERDGKWCAAHASRCPSDWDVGRGSCESFCGVGVPGASSHADCLFAYCSVQTGYCDNDETDDRSIVACVSDITGTTGAWCATFETACPGDWDATRGPCESYCGNNIPTSASPTGCQFAYCSVVTGFCDNEEPGDVSIETCVSRL